MTPGGLLLPPGRTTDLPWLRIDELQVGFSLPEPVTAGDVDQRQEIHRRLSVPGLRGQEHRGHLGIV